MASSAHLMSSGSLQPPTATPGNCSFFPGSLPPEILSGILQQCNTIKDLTSMISTCCRIHRVWKLCTSRILSTIGQSTIPGFDLALQAVSANHFPFPSSKLT